MIDDNGWKEMIKRTADTVDTIQEKGIEIAVGIASLNIKMDEFVKKDDCIQTSNDFKLSLDRLNSELIKLEQKKANDFVVDYKTFLKDWRTYLSLGIVLTIAFFALFAGCM